MKSMLKRTCFVFSLISLLLPTNAAEDAALSSLEKLPFVILDSSACQIVGKKIKNDNYLRGWEGDGSGAKWSFDIPETGTWYLYFEMSSPDSEGGTAVVLIDDTEKIKVEVPSTKSFNDFELKQFAQIPLKKGKHTLSILSEKAKARYLMDLKFGVLAQKPISNFQETVLAPYEKAVADVLEGKSDFSEVLVKASNLLKTLPFDGLKKKMFEGFKKNYPHQIVWLQQDSKGKIEDFLLKQDETLWKSVFSNLAESIKKNPHYQQDLVAKIENASYGDNNKDWAKAYEEYAWLRRQMRLDNIRKHGNEIIFAKHHVFGSVSNIYLITETEGSNLPSYLCTLDLSTDKKGSFAKETILYDPGEGMVRDPELSFDAKKMLFAMRPTKKHFDSTHSRETKGIPEMNYQIYEMDLASKNIRALTNTETYGSSFEPCYLPNGDIMFSSARIVQHITCGWGDHSNLFIMNKDGKYARRVGFDQTNTAFPTVLNDGRVVFTRRDYNDRGQSSAHALFVMNSDGTGQTEFYGNQTGLPNSFHHARAIPNSSKVITIIGGYHTTQGGKLAIIDANKGVEKDEGLIEMPGYRKPKVGDGYDDNYGKQGEQYSNPYALNEKEYIVSIAEKNSRGTPYGIYYLTDDGERELLAYDPRVSSLQAVLKAPRKKPNSRLAVTDYKKNDGVFYVQNVYHGEAAKGIKPGSIKKLRVIEMLYKPATLGTSQGRGPGGMWDTVIPSGHGLATFDSKRILGDATVYPDGSAKFKCSARKPVYFQLLDENNRVVQTMRSWATLMPGESFSCIGCHENKLEAPLSGQANTIALKKAPEDLTLFYGEPRAFSYIKEVQPVFDKHCISCHSEGKEAGEKLLLTATPYLDDTTAKKRFYQSYFALTNARPENGHQPEEFGFHPGNKIWGKRVAGKRMPDEPNRYVSWYTRFELMKPYPPYRSGSIRSGLVQKLEAGHQNLTIPQEDLDKIRAWIDLNIPFAGEYDESNIWNDDEKKVYRERMEERLRNEQIEAENIKQFIQDGQPS